MPLCVYLPVFDHALAPGRIQKNFVSCPHCRLKGNYEVFIDLLEGRPRVERSDGAFFHLYLTHPPTIYGDDSKRISNQIISFGFWCVHDLVAPEGRMIGIAISVDRKIVKKWRALAEQIADLLTAHLEGDLELASDYTVEEGKLIELSASKFRSIDTLCFKEELQSG